MTDVLTPEVIAQTRVDYAPDPRIRLLCESHEVVRKERDEERRLYCYGIAAIHAATHPPVVGMSVEDVCRSVAAKRWGKVEADHLYPPEVKP